LSRKKYNLGCGRTRLEGYVNVDINPGENVDLVLDLRTELVNIPDGDASEVVMFHALEHLEKIHYIPLFRQLNRILETGGSLYLSFPDFEVCSKFYLENVRGAKEFWEATIFGRGDFPHDQHRSAATRNEVAILLVQLGFEIVKLAYEPKPNECNAIIWAKRVSPIKVYADFLREI